MKLLLKILSFIGKSITFLFGCFFALYIVLFPVLGSLVIIGLSLNFLDKKNVDKFAQITIFILIILVQATLSFFAMKHL